MDEKVKCKQNSDGILQDYATIQLSYDHPKTLNQSSTETVEYKAEIEKSNEAVLSDRDEQKQIITPKRR